MAYIYKCSSCGTTGQFSSRQSALAASWALACIETKDRVKYFVFCPAAGCAPKWLREALSDAKRAAAAKTE